MSAIRDTAGRFCHQGATFSAQTGALAGIDTLEAYTGKSFEADYVYVMQFGGDRISHMTKIWNDGISLSQLGWA